MKYAVAVAACVAAIVVFWLMWRDEGYGAKKMTCPAGEELVRKGNTMKCRPNARLPGNAKKVKDQNACMRRVAAGQKVKWDERAGKCVQLAGAKPNNPAKPNKPDEPKWSPGPPVIPEVEEDDEEYEE